MRASQSTKPYVYINAKANSLTLSINATTVYSFDKKGRLIGAYLEGTNYKRGFDNSILKKWSEPEQGQKRRQREKLGDRNRRAFLHRMTETLESIARNPDNYQLEIPGDEEETWNWFNRCLTYDWEKLERDAEHFSEIYKPVTILPPDQYYALVLQISEGCSYNKCTFCNFYRDRRFRIKSPGEVMNHIDQVNDFFDESLGLRRSIFLADANALIIPQPRLIRILEIINENYTLITDPDRRRELHSRRREGEAVFEGIYSFIDLFTGEYKSSEEFREMASLGVKRAYIGMESGSEALLDFLNKPGSKQNMIDAVNKVKAGGVDVGVIVLVGAGGREYHEGHIEDTADALNRMRLDEHDFIYFSEFRPQPGTPYHQIAKEEGIQSLSRAESDQQEERLREKLQYTGKDDSPQLSTYDIREFLY